jgi:hypothetical protein
MSAGIVLVLAALFVIFQTTQGPLTNKLGVTK